MNTPHPTPGIDLDGCVDEAPTFFSILTNSCITYQDDREKADHVLMKYRIRWDELILVNSFEEKAAFSQGYRHYFDDQPEMLKDIPQGVKVMLVRNEGNYDFDTKKWLLSKHTGKII